MKPITFTFSGYPHSILPGYNLINLLDDDSNSQLLLSIQNDENLQQKKANRVTLTKKQPFFPGSFDKVEKSNAVGRKMYKQNGNRLINDCSI